MIRRVVDFALNNRLSVLAFALLVVGAGIVAFHNLPIDAYPDVANNYVEIINPVAWNICGADRAANHHSAGDCSEWHPWCCASAVVLPVWPVRLKAGFR